MRACCARSHACGSRQSCPVPALPVSIAVVTPERRQKSSASIAERRTAPIHMGMQVDQPRRDNRSGYVADVCARASAFNPLPICATLPRANATSVTASRLLRRIESLGRRGGWGRCSRRALHPRSSFELCRSPQQIDEHGRHLGLLRCPVLLQRTRSTSRSPGNRSCSSLPGIIRCAACAMP